MLMSVQGPLEGSGYGYCALTVDGQAAIKTGNVAGSLTGVRVAQRRTIEGSLVPPARRLPVRPSSHPLSFTPWLCYFLHTCRHTALLPRLQI